MNMRETPSINGNQSDTTLHPDEPTFPPAPEQLQYLIVPAIHYGRKYRFDDAVQWLVENVGESDLETLAALAERARLSDDYRRFLEWSNEVDDIVERIVDECYPYTIDTFKSRNALLQLINEADDPPGMAERCREKRLRRLAEANDTSDVAECRKEARMRLASAANDKVHDMDVYFLFALLDACDMKFE